jgi:hypothetical protein
MIGRRHPRFVLYVLLSAAVCCLGQADEHLDQLKSHADSGPAEQRAEACIAVAQHQLSAADKLFTAGNTEQAQAAVRDVADYSEKAAAAAEHNSHKLKNTEIAVRKMAHKLEDIKRSLAFEDQPPVQAAINRLEKARTNMLNKMFGKDAK